MKTTCPKCRTSYDIPTAAVLAAARPIIAREAGRVRSPAKASASRANGRLGGRPRIHDATKGSPGMITWDEVESRKLKGMGVAAGGHARS